MDAKNNESFMRNRVTHSLKVAIYKILIEYNIIINCKVKEPGKHYPSETIKTNTTIKRTYQHHISLGNMRQDPSKGHSTKQLAYTLEKYQGHERQN